MGTLTGCAHIYYAPNAHNVPFFRGKGEGVIHAAIGAGTDEVDLSVDIQTAYAVTKEIGFMANYYRSMGKGENGAGNTEGGNGHLLEFGLGYVIPLKIKPTLSRFTEELVRAASIIITTNKKQSIQRYSTTGIFCSLPLAGTMNLWI